MKLIYLLNNVKAGFKYALLLLMFWISSSIAMADNLYVKSLTHNPFDLVGAYNSKTDFNGLPCALLKIILPKEASNIAFEGNIIDTQNDGSEVNVYIEQGSKYLTIKSAGFGPLEIYFPNYDISALKGNQTYKIEIASMETLRQMKKSANGTALAYSIIPGLGLIQKGRTGEGISYLIGDVALLGVGIGLSSNASSQKKIMNDVNTGIDEYNKAKSKYDSSRSASYICFGAAGAVYVVNLIRSYIATPKPNAKINWGITPVVANVNNNFSPSVGISLAMTYTF